MKVRKPLSTPVIYLFFIIGLLAATCFRMLIVFEHLSPELFRPIWYIGVIGYLFFFLYRFIITEKRRRTIQESGLIAKLEKNQCLEQDDLDNTLYILKSLMVSREKWNYFAIFILSILAIAVDLILSSTSI